MKHLVSLYLILAWTSVGWIQAADLPVRKVVLYKHGVGFFERAGAIPAGESVRLRFKATEMDDVLKSLVIAQREGGVSSVRYDSSDPLSKRLEVFPFHVGNEFTLATILDQFKGAEIEMSMPSGPIRGKIVTARSVAGTNRETARQELLIVEGGRFRTIDPAAASGLAFLEVELQQRFDEYLEIVANSRSVEKRSLLIESSGDSGDVTAGYVVPTAVWKSSYRLSLRNSGDATIEGWAIVDNTSDEDWGEVSLSLVSGLPVSFVNPLYAPRYLARPTVQLEQDRAWKPMLHNALIETFNGRTGTGSGVLLGRLTDSTGAVIPGARIVATNEVTGDTYNAESDTLGRYWLTGLPAGRYDIVASSPGFSRTVMSEISLVGGQSRNLNLELRLGAVTDAIMVTAEAATLHTESAMMSSTVESTASGVDLGELFEYRIDKPVTIRKGESAMVPFVQRGIETRRVVLFDESVGSLHPVRALEFTNKSGQTLDGGPITVYDAGAYAGESLMATLKDGDKRFISYAVDLGTRITTAFDSESRLLSEFHVRGGLMTTQTVLRRNKTYTIHNVDDRGKTVILEHPYESEFRLVGMTPLERTAAVYRFQVEIPAGETKKFPVHEERLVQSVTELDMLEYEEVAEFVTNVELSAEGRAQLQRIADQQVAIRRSESRRADLKKSLQQIVDDQERLRRNIETLAALPGQNEKVQEYALKLTRGDDQLAQIENDMSTLLARESELEDQLEKMIESLEF